MGNTNTLPVISQAKSAVQALTGDCQGARETQEKFLHECPIVSQGTSLYYLIGGHKEKCIETNLRSVGTLSNFADGIPVVGHVKGTIHYIAGDREGGDNAMKSASRTAGVIGGGVGVVGGVAGGAAMDGTTTAVDSLVHDEFRPSGVIAAGKEVVTNPSGGAVFDLVAGPVFDGIAGFGAGQITAKIQSGKGPTVMDPKVTLTSETVSSITDVTKTGASTTSNVASNGAGSTATTTTGFPSSATSTGSTATNVSGVGSNSATTGSSTTTTTGLPSKTASSGSTFTATTGITPNPASGGSTATSSTGVASKTAASGSAAATTKTATVIATKSTASSTSAPATVASGAATGETAAAAGVSACAAGEGAAPATASLSTKIAGVATVIGATTGLVKGVKECIDSVKSENHQSNQSRGNNYGGSSGASHTTNGTNGSNSTNTPPNNTPRPEASSFNHPALKVDRNQTDKAYLDEMILKCAPDFSSFINALLAKEDVSRVAKRAKNYADIVKPSLEHFRGRAHDFENNSTNDTETTLKKISCVHWDASNLGSTLKTDMGFLIYVAFKSPEILMFNELLMDANDSLELIKDVASVLRNIPSSPGSREKRGTAILYKQKRNFRFLRHSTDQKLSEDGKAGILLISADFEFKPEDRNAAITPRKEFYRFICCYNRVASEISFNTLGESLRTLASSEDHTVIIAGNFNLNKEFWLDKWKLNGFVDILEPKIKTNSTTEGKTAIDYVMTCEGNDHHVSSHVPFSPSGINNHFVVLFDVAPSIGPGACADRTCYKCFAGSTTQQN